MTTPRTKGTLPDAEMKLSISAFLNPVLRAVELARDRGVAFFVAQLGDEVDADVLAIPAIHGSPDSPRPDLDKFLGLNRISGQEGTSEPLQICALLTLGDSSGALGLK